jgi:hypothetical protein
MRTFHPIAIVTAVCFCVGLLRYGLLHAGQEAGQSYVTQTPASDPQVQHEAYKARLATQEAARKAAVAQRKQMRARRRMQGW